MAETQTDTETRRTRTIRGSAWRAGVAAGLLGGIAMGVIMSFAMADFLRDEMAAIVALDGGIVGWFVLMSLSAVFGVVFAAVMTRVPGLETYSDNPSAVASIGAAFGVLLWFVVMGFAIPLWLDLVGRAALDSGADILVGGAIELPYLPAVGFVAYLTYGFVLGGTFPYLR